ncbi:uncharacterized protein PAC_00816 [Phialocephala subalpina]|uniref:Hsp70 protein n=1 Tax=Phialocephala subalpina TaxID=576137 RepID=A0A1L7WDS9_9HELO|nr:uncharacterized protein PAC_00816 [Phialocephala subalpina]
MLVCDAGGGTTDLAVLQKVGDSDDGTQLKELIPVAGYNFGSTNIDESFCTLIDERLQGTDLELKDNTAWTMMHSADFQRWKLAFGTLDEEEFKEFPVKVSGLKAKISNEKAKIALGSMMFSHDDFRQLFDIEVDKMIDNIQNQMDIMDEKYPNKKIDYLVLSGGLGSSAYVQKRLKEALTGTNAHSAAPSLKVIAAASDEPQLAVLKGLVASYGVVCDVPYDQKLDVGHTPYKDQLDGKLWLKDHIKWVIEKDYLINVDDNKSHEFTRIFTRGKPRKWKSTIVICHNDADELLDNVWVGKERNADVITLAEVESDLSKVPIDRFTPRKGKRKFLGMKPGETYYKARYDVKFVIGAATDARFELWFSDQQYTAQNAIKIDWREGASIPAQPAEATPKKVYSTGRTGWRNYEWGDDDYD